ncbi:uncharacterized protein LOC124207533 [Daphnia pulex]|uniref:uncharacterized protein LOC124207533 n=1 Tax=Daphnia pulex TaxID=6669 RepID=UPI001EE0F41D|nr:uncharacterized protein LOC124207533 [Daphnia pulex]
MLKPSQSEASESRLGFKKVRFVTITFAFTWITLSMAQGKSSISVKVPVTAGIWRGDDGLNPDGSSPAAQQQQQQQPWSSANAMQLPTQLLGPMLQSEWNVDSSVQTVKRMKRRHEPRIVDLPLLTAGKVAAEVSGVDPIAQVVPSSSLAISKPYFEATWPTNVSVVLGQPAVLKCRTRLLGDRMLSWIRQRDLHVLTSALVSYTSDGRFSVHHQPTSDDWELRISTVQARDAGFYECQVNTEPKINWPVHLQVHTGQAQIAGPSEVHVRQGSTLSLTCSLRGTIIGQDSNLSWYHDDQPVLLETARNSLSLATERSEHFISSRFLLPRASAVDGGNYTCRPSEALPVSVLVHVLSGEHPAAMQHGNRSGGGGSCLPNTVQVMSILCLTYWTLHWLGSIQFLMTR